MSRSSVLQAETIVNLSGPIQFSPAMREAVDELVSLRVSSLNALASARTMEVMIQCASYNSRRWEKFLLKAFQCRHDSQLTSRYLGLAATDIAQVVSKVRMYETGVPTLIRLRKIRCDPILRTCQVSGVSPLVVEMRSRSEHRRTLTSCIRAICSEILRIGRKNSQRTDLVLVQLSRCQGSDLHAELLSSLLDACRKRRLDALTEIRKVLAWLATDDPNEDDRREWRILCHFSLFLCKRLSTEML